MLHTWVKRGSKSLRSLWLCLQATCTCTCIHNQICTSLGAPGASSSNIAMAFQGDQYKQTTLHSSNFPTGGALVSAPLHHHKLLPPYTYLHLFTIFCPLACRHPLLLSQRIYQVCPLLSDPTFSKWLLLLEASSQVTWALNWSTTGNISSTLVGCATHTRPLCGFLLLCIAWIQTTPWLQIT